MAYSSDDQVRFYLSSLGSSAGGFGTDIIGTAAMAYKITDADSLIDMILSKRYSTPFTTTPPAITTISKILSGWFALRSVYSDEIPKALEFVEDDYKKSMELLERLRKKEIDLPSGTSTSGAVETEKGSATLYWSNTKGYTPVFDLDSDLNWKVDQDRIEDIGSARE